MRKKSHISLAAYLVNSEGMEVLKLHKKAFYMGSIQPDCTIAFLTHRHSLEETFHILKKEIRKITEDYDIEKGISSSYCRRLGVITHYIADYFTFPHNEFFDGNMKAHCRYEKELKFFLRSYVKSEDGRREQQEGLSINSVEDICFFIKEMHKEYAQAIKEVKIDCEYIVTLCHFVVSAILQFSNKDAISKQLDYRRAIA